MYLWYVCRPTGEQVSVCIVSRTHSSAQYLSNGARRAGPEADSVHVAQWLVVGVTLVLSCVLLHLLTCELVTGYTPTTEC